jgi:hypothetical protein
MPATGPKGIDWDAQPLGVEADAVIAARLGCAPNSVGRARRIRGMRAALPLRVIQPPPIDSSFGSWTVLDILKNGGALKVRCGCGFTGIRTTASIVRGRSTECHGCVQRSREGVITAGDVFGFWTVLSLDVVEQTTSSGEAKRRRMAHLECICGTRRFIRPDELQHGLSASCGCSKPSGPRSPHWRGYGELPAHFFRQFESGARHRGIPFELTIRDAWLLFVRQRGRCALSGCVIAMPTRSGRIKAPATASMDRIDSKGPYRLDNVAWVHKSLNIMKRELANDQFIAMCEQVADHQRALRKARARPPEIEHTGQVRLLAAPTPPPESEPSASPRARRR